MIRSGAGILEIRGRDALDLLHRLSTNDLLKLEVGSVVGTVFTTEKGRVIDYVKVIRLDEKIVLLTSSGAGKKVKKWIERFCIMEEVEITDVSYSTVEYVLFGNDLFSAVPVSDIRLLPPNRVLLMRNSGLSSMVLHDRDFGVSVLRVIAEAPQEDTLKRLFGNRFLGAKQETFEDYRISNGIPGAECELTESFNPYEVGLQHAVSLSKGCYIGQEVLARLDTYGKANKRRLVGLRFQESANSRERRPVLYTESGEVGWRTSYSPRPVEGSFIGLGVVANELVRQGDTVWLFEGVKKVRATLTEFTYGH